MYQIAEWTRRYEVSYKGREPKPGEELRAGPLAFIRLKVNGHKLSAGFRRLKEKAGARTYEVFGIFCKFLEIAGNQPKDQRGKLLNENDGPATVGDLAFILDCDIEQANHAIQVLTSIGWIAADKEENTKEEQLNTIQLNTRGRKFPENSGNDAPSDKKSLCAEVTWNGSIFSIPDEILARWKTAYAAVDVQAQILRAAEWLIANPAKRKRNYYRFLIGWLGRTQERGGDLRSNAPALEPKPTRLCDCGCGKPVTIMQAGRWASKECRVRKLGW